MHFIVRIEYVEANQPLAGCYVLWLDFYTCAYVQCCCKLAPDQELSASENMGTHC